MISSAWFRGVQVLGFFRKELVEILRQPKLLLTLVFGPFLILLLFGAGYKNSPLTLRTLFVGPPDSVYEDVIQDYADQLSDWVVPTGYTSDMEQANRELVAGDIDVIVEFPADPVDTVMKGEQAQITVIHDELDPIQQTAIEFATRLAVDEVNSTILTRIVGVGQDVAKPLDPVRRAIVGAAAKLSEQAAGVDQAQLQAMADELQTSTSGAAVLLDATHGFLSELRPDTAPDELSRLDQARTAIGRINELSREVVSTPGEARAAKLGELTQTVTQLDQTLGQLQTVDPAILVRPFKGETQVAAPETVGITDFFAPAAIVLLVQHLGVTLAALSFVRDRALGLFEVLRVGPVTALRNLLGKYGAYATIGAVVAAALTALVVLGLDVPLAGTLGWVAIVLALVLFASLGIGFVVSLIAGSDSQAVQFAMIMLLASLFFGGFFLDLERLTYPVKVISLLLPVTYGIRGLQDIMLRGQPPDVVDVAGLGALAVVTFLGSWMLLRRRLRVV